MANCKMCKADGAGSPYKGKLFHMACRMEQKRLDGKLPEFAPVMKGARHASKSSDAKKAR